MGSCLAVVCRSVTSQRVTKSHTSKRKKNVSNECPIDKIKNYSRYTSEM